MKMATSRVILLLLFISLGLPSFAAPQLLIAAASSLKFPLDEIAERYHQQTGLQVKPVYGSSGKLFRQIMQGAPYALFLSADEQYVFKLADNHKALDRGVVYATGQLVFLTPNNSPVIPDSELKGLGEALTSGKLRRLAIANPTHAPYGIAAREVLHHIGLWEDLQRHLVYGENVAQTAQFALSGNTQGGIVAYATVLSPTLKGHGNYALIPADWHVPLRQRMVLLNNPSEPASAFFRYLRSDATKAVWRKYGFITEEG